METVFWSCVLLITYTLIGYPVCSILIGWLNSRELKTDDQLRDVTIVIPVHNGEKELSRKLDNCLLLDYPSERLRIVVVSDGSTDGTVAVAESRAGVECIALTERVGKVAAQNEARQYIQTEIVVFTDVGISVDKQALRSVVSRFADDRVGVVSCRDEIQDDGPTVSGESLYIRYDMMVRSASRRSGSLIGVTGGFYALRRHLLDDAWPAEFSPDFYSTLHAIQHDLIAIEDDTVRAYYGTTSSDRDEFTRKVRTITRGMFTLFGNAVLLNPVKYPSIAWKLWSHKIFRWLTPFYLLVLFVSNFALITSNPISFYNVAFVLQLLGWVVSILFWRIGGEARLFRIGGSFAAFNAAIVRSWWNLFTGHSFAVWQPTARMG